jgi:hypothetical protein
MMASDRPAGEPTASNQPIPLPPITTPPAVVVPTRLTPSPFLNALDIFQAAGVVLLAFLLASFAVKNTDFFQHLATGRLIAEGEYQFGKDPFCHTTSEASWVNHAWLFDWVFFQIYERFGGGAVVIVKAAMIALLAALLLLLRKKSHNLWFAVIGVAMALLAMAPRMLLQPITFSILFLTLTLFAITHWSGAKDRRRLPIAIGVIFALWSNFDSWFLFGPLTLGLFLLGEWVQTLQHGKSSEDRFDLKTLALALGVGIAACMINPHHVNVWEIPDLFNSQAAELTTTDAELASVFRPLLDGRRTFFSLGGGAAFANPINSWALVFLTLLSVVSFGVNFRAFRWSHLFLFLIFLILGLSRFRLVPFFAVVAVMVLNWNYGEFLDRFSKREWSAQAIHLFGFPRRMTRVVSLLIGLALLVAVRPGWLNQDSKDPLRARWLTWEVIPDPGLVGGAERLAKMREEQLLPENAKALVLDVGFAHYLNWFAPKEKTFADYRLNVHEATLSDFVLLRDWLRGKLDAKMNEKVPPLLQKYGITHLVIASGERLDRPGRADSGGQASSLLMTGDPFRTNWTVWDITGRVWLLGWNGQKTIPEAQFQRLTYNPIKKVYSPTAAKLDEPSNLNPFGTAGWLESYWDIPTPTPGQVDDAYSHWLYFQLLREQSTFQAQAVLRLSQLTSGIGPIPFLLRANEIPPQKNRGEVNASIIRSIRSAREATFQNPDSPEGFIQLSRAYNMGFPTLPEFRDLMVLSNLQRGLIRTSPETVSEAYRLDLFSSVMQLSDLYRGTNTRPSFDLLVDLSKYANGFRRVPVSGLKPEEQMQAIESINRPFEMEGKGQGPPPQEALDRIQNQFELAITGLDDPLSRAWIARLMGLNREAREILQTINAESGDAADRVERIVYELDSADVELSMGYVEDAYKRLKLIESKFGDRFTDRELLGMYQNIRMGMSQKISQRLQNRVQLDSDFRLTFRQLKIRVCFVLGKFSEAIQEDQTVLQEAERELIGRVGPDLLQRVRKLPSNDLFVITSSFAPTVSGIQPTVLHRIGSEYLQLLYQDSLNRLVGEAQLIEAIHTLHVRVALMNLEKGDNAEAKFHFEQALKPAGIVYPCRYDSLAQEYLNLLKAESEK